MKIVIRSYGEYKIVMEGNDFDMYKGDQLLITSMSLDKVDRYWDDYMFILTE